MFKKMRRHRPPNHEKLALKWTYDCRKNRGKKFAYQFCVYLLTFGIPFPVVAVREKIWFFACWTGFATSIFSLNRCYFLSSLSHICGWWLCRQKRNMGVLEWLVNCFWCNLYYNSNHVLKEKLFWVLAYFQTGGVSVNSNGPRILQWLENEAYVF